VINEDTGAKTETITGEEGHYRVTSLPPGGYRVEVQKPGFDRLARKGLVITTGQTIAVDLTLKVGRTRRR
jgi:protocatechuate 3,4-dioxygenase beta subunit